MSSTEVAEHPTSSDSSPSTVQFIIDALNNYTEVTGIDLSDNPFAAAIKDSTSPEAILELLLQDREKEFKEYRNGYRKLTNCLRPVVKFIQSFSGILREAVSLASALVSVLVSHTYHSATLLVTFSETCSTSKHSVCCHRYSPFRTSLECAFQPVPP